MQNLLFGICVFVDLPIDGLVQNCSISSALAMEILQSCTTLVSQIVEHTEWMNTWEKLQKI